MVDLRMVEGFTHQVLRAEMAMGNCRESRFAARKSLDSASAASPAKVGAVVSRGAQGVLGTLSGDQLAASKKLL